MAYQGRPEKEKRKTLVNFRKYFSYYNLFFLFMLIFYASFINYELSKIEAYKKINKITTEVIQEFCRIKKN